MDKPRQSLLYEFGELSRPYPLYIGLMSNHAGQRQNEPLMRQERGMDIEGVSRVNKVALIPH